MLVDSPKPDVKPLRGFKASENHTGHMGDKVSLGVGESGVLGVRPRWSETGEGGWGG